MSAPLKRAGTDGRPLAAKELDHRAPGDAITSCQLRAGRTYTAPMGQEQNFPERTPSLGVPLTGPAEQRATAFLDHGLGSEKRLACTDCITRELCRAVAAPLVERTTDGLIDPQDIAMLQGYGVAVSANRYRLCPERLVMTATRRSVSGDYVIPDDDPLRRSAAFTQIAEPLRAATRSLVQLLDKHIQI
jgi:hypothetical protein